MGRASARESSLENPFALALRGRNHYLGMGRTLSKTKSLVLPCGAMGYSGITVTVRFCIWVSSVSPSRSVPGLTAFGVALAC